MLGRLLNAVWLLFGLLVGPAAATELELPKAGLAPDEVAVVVNRNDPVSVKIGDYYLQRRGIPRSNLIQIELPVGQSTLSRTDFQRVKQEVDHQTPAGVQAYALAWTLPYRVDCMSVTSAFAFGFDPAYCSTKCGATRPSPYFNSSSHAPWTDFKLRPAMLLAGQTWLDVKQLIDRGVRSDHTYPDGTGYLLKTSDRNRNVRSAFFQSTQNALGEVFRLQILEADSIRNKKDVLFYFTGLTHVPNLSTLHFLPGAVADHLTSTGGALTDTKQMSSLKWLEAGATGSFGTVVEPCNHVTKFPHPGVVMWHYADGDSLIEAYWKSVAWPGEGVFIGEPLAQPFAPSVTARRNHELEVQWFSPEWRNVRLEQAGSSIGPYQPVRVYPAKPGRNRFVVSQPESGFYRLQP